jgi:SAM-dependent methyltransferase
MIAPTLETIACDLCGCPDSTFLYQVTDQLYGKPGEFRLIQCAQCGLVYLNPRPTPQMIGSYYPDLDYHAFTPPNPLKAALLRNRNARLGRMLLHGLPVGANTLEIGCGTGELLAALQAQGASVTGIEPNAAAAHEAHKRHRLTVHAGFLDEWHTRLPPQHYDLIVMKYALEHVHSPTETLTQIKGLLKPGGVGVFWLPNWDSWDAQIFGALWRGIDAPRHLTLFTPATIRLYAEKIGLRCEAVAYSGVPNDWIGSLGAVLRARGIPKGVTRWVSLENPVMLIAGSPVSQVAAFRQRSGRMVVRLRNLTV